MQEVVRQTPDSKQARQLLVKMMRQNDAGLDTTTAKNRATELTSLRYRYFLDFNPATRLNEVKCPVLLLNGTVDQNVAADANINALTKALSTNRDVTSKKLPGVNHQFQGDPAEWTLVNGQPRETFSAAALELIRSWIAVRAQVK